MVGLMEFIVLSVSNGRPLCVRHQVRHYRQLQKPWETLRLQREMSAGCSQDLELSVFLSKGSGCEAGVQFSARALAKHVWATFDPRF